MKKKIAIDIDNTYREIYDAQRELLSEYLGITEREDAVKISLKDDPYSFSKDFDFRDNEDFEDYIFGDFSFQVYGTAPLCNGVAPQDLNLLYAHLLKYGRVEVISNIRDRAKSSTLHFLSTNSFLGNKICFYHDFSKIWMNYDIVVTSNPYVLGKKNLENPKKKSIKIERQYNKDIPADFTVKNLLEVRNLKI